MTSPIRGTIRRVIRSEHVQRVLPPAYQRWRSRKFEQRTRDAVLHVGPHTYGHGQIRLRTWNFENALHIGKFCSIADNVEVFLGGNHHIEWASTYPFAPSATAANLHGERAGQPSSRGDVVIGNDVWVGSHVSIMSGVRIGDGAVIAAYSHVVRDVAPYELVGGNPAHHIKFRFEPGIIERLHALSWWDWSEEAIAAASDLLSAPPTHSTLDQLEAMRDARP